MRPAPLQTEGHSGPVLQDLDLALPSRRVGYYCLFVRINVFCILVHTGTVRFLWLVMHFIMFYIGSQTGGA